MKGLHMKQGTRKFKVLTYAGYNDKAVEVIVQADDFQYTTSVGDSTGKGYIAKSVTFYNNCVIGDEAHGDAGKALSYARRVNVAVFDSPQQVTEVTEPSKPQDRVHVGQEPWFDYKSLSHGSTFGDIYDKLYGMPPKTPAKNVVATITLEPSAGMYVAQSDLTRLLSRFITAHGYTSQLKSLRVEVK